MRKLSILASAIWREIRFRELDCVYRQSIFFASRLECYYCTECDTVGASGRSCPSCGSACVLSLGRVIQQQPSGAIHLESL